MKIPNLDSKKTTKPSRKLVEFISEDFQLIMAGKTHSGKTNLLMFMLLKPIVYFDKIYIYTQNMHQDKMQELIKIMEPISKTVGYNVLEIGGEENNYIDS